MHNYTYIKFIIYLIILWALAFMCALITKKDINTWFCVLAVTEILRRLF